MCIEKAADKLLAGIAEYQDMLPAGFKDLQQYSIKIEGGDSILTGIINNRFMSVARMHLVAQGLTSAWHTHEEGETFIFQRGAPYYMEIKGVNNAVKVQEDRSCYVPPGTPHRLAGTEGDSWSIVVLIPGSRIFPVGAENA